MYKKLNLWEVEPFGGCPVRQTRLFLSSAGSLTVCGNTLRCALFQKGIYVLLQREKSRIKAEWLGSFISLFKMVLLLQLKFQDHGKLAPLNVMFYLKEAPGNITGIRGWVFLSWNFSCNNYQLPYHIILIIIICKSN